MGKICNECELEKDANAFSPDNRAKDGLQGKCKECRQRLYQAQQSTRYKSDRVYKRKRLDSGKKYRVDKKEYISERRKIIYKKRKAVIFERYGDKCECCGETTYEFLVIDHVRGGGNKERKVLSAKKLFNLLYNTLDKMPDYRLLCQNCNASLGHFGYCPHSVDKTDMVL